MKTFKIFSTAALALMMAACSSEDAALNNSPAQQQGRKVHFTATIAAPSGNAGTRTEYTEDTENKKITVAWKVGDEIALVHDKVMDVVKVKTVNADGSATITGDITVGTNGEDVTAYYPAAAIELNSDKNPVPAATYTANLLAQDGTLKFIQDKLDTRMGEGKLKVDGDKATLSDNVKLASQIAIWKLTLQDNAATSAALAATQVKIKSGENELASTATLTQATSTVYLALPCDSYDELTIEATVGKDTYSFTKSAVTLNASAYYQSTVTMSLPKIVDLSTVTTATTIEDGYTVTGTLGANVKISIAAGATVTLDNVSINADGTWNSDNWAGLTCLGNATIILKDGSENTVKGFSADYPGIYVPEDAENPANNKTLTIKGETAGTGKLTASSNGMGAGIGGGMMIGCGNIEIQGGDITATGVTGAGIGGGFKSSCGNISISGGTVEATGGANAAGIGSGGGSSDTCGDISISGGTVTATGGNDGAGIGSGNQGTCVDITISGGTITANGGDRGAGIGSGNQGSCGDILISGGTITATGGYCAAGIGSGSCGNCVNISISGGTVKATGGAYSAGIGSGSEGTCGAITISGGTVEATGGQWAAGIGSCNDGTCGDIAITTGVTQVTATKGDGGINSIGKGDNNGSCGTVTIDPSLNQATSTKVIADDTLTLTPAQ